MKVVSSSYPRSSSSSADSSSSVVEYYTNNSSTERSSSSPFHHHHHHLSENESMMTYYTDESVAMRQNKRLTYDTFVPMQSSTTTTTTSDEENRSDREEQGSWRRDNLSIDTNHAPPPTMTSYSPQQQDVDVRDETDEVEYYRQQQEQKEESTLSPGLKTSEDIRSKRRQRLARMAAMNNNNNKKGEQEQVGGERTTTMMMDESPTKLSRTTKPAVLSSPFMESSVGNIISSNREESPSPFNFSTRENNNNNKRVGGGGSSSNPINGGGGRAFETYSSPASHHRMMTSPSSNRSHYSYQDENVFANDSRDDDDDEQQQQEEERHSSSLFPNPEAEARYKQSLIAAAASSSNYQRNEDDDPHDDDAHGETIMDTPISPRRNHHPHHDDEDDVSDSEDVVVADSDAEAEYDESTTTSPRPQQQQQRIHHHPTPGIGEQQQNLGVLGLRQERDLAETTPPPPAPPMRRQHYNTSEPSHVVMEAHQHQYEEKRPISPNYHPPRQQQQQQQQRDAPPPPPPSYNNNIRHENNPHGPMMFQEPPMMFQEPPIFQEPPMFQEQLFSDDMFHRNRRPPPPPSPQLPPGSNDYVRNRDLGLNFGRGNIPRGAPLPPPPAMLMSNLPPYGPNDVFLQQRHGPTYNMPPPQHFEHNNNNRMQPSRRNMMSGVAALAPSRIGEQVRRQPPVYEERSCISQGSNRAVNNNNNTNGGCQAFQCQSVITRIWACGAMKDVIDSEPTKRFEVFAGESVTAFSMGINDLSERVGYTKPRQAIEDVTDNVDEENSIQSETKEEEKPSAGNFSFLPAAPNTAHITDAFEAFSEEVKNVTTQAAKANDAISEVMNRNFNIGIAQNGVDLGQLSSVDEESDSASNSGPAAAPEKSPEAHKPNNVAYETPQNGLYASIAKGKRRRDMFLKKIQKDRTKNDPDTKPTSPRESVPETSASATEQLREIYRNLQQSIQPESSNPEPLKDSAEAEEVDLMGEDKRSSKDSSDPNISLDRQASNNPDARCLTNNETMSLSGMMSMMEKQSFPQLSLEDSLPTTKEESEDAIEAESDTAPDSRTKPNAESKEQPETETVWERELPSNSDNDTSAESFDYNDLGMNVVNKVAATLEPVCSTDAEIEAELTNFDDHSVMSLSDDNGKYDDYDGPTDSEILAELMGEIDDEEEPDIVKSIFDDGSDSEDDEDAKFSSIQQNETFEIDETAIHAASSLLESLSKPEPVPPKKMSSKPKHLSSSSVAVSRKNERNKQTTTNHGNGDSEASPPPLTVEQLKFRAFMITVFLYFSGILGFVFEKIILSE
eukprot:scaffold1586_cov88-Cylindrotheca_fusiformis.AAC.3